MKISPFFLLFLLGLLSESALYERHMKTIPNNFPPPPNEIINVHIICHSHDDTGWLKTVDQYYTGIRNDIQIVSVGRILDDVIANLVMDSKRRFNFVEMAFFERYWNERTESYKNIIRKLVANGQLNFLNGGYCMNDEATSHYRAIIDQMTRGHNFIYKNFGESALPRVGWHIDPFGHASSMANLMSKMDFDGFFFGRIDYQDHLIRLDNLTMEFLWRGSETLGEASDIFTGVLFDGYGPPLTFCFDSIHCDSSENTPIQDNPYLMDYNVEARATLFAFLMWNMAAYYKGNDIMVTMGDDFRYQGAADWFVNIDKLINHINSNPNQYKLNLLYSTPYDYLYAKHNSHINFTTKTDDFFPYASANHAYWTGYFTSRPALKRYAFEMNNFLNTVWQLECINSLYYYNNMKCDPLECNWEQLDKAVSLIQHHDAITGTEKQAVSDDYALRLSMGYMDASLLARSVVISLINGSNSEFTRIDFCPRFNESECVITKLVEPNTWIAIIVYSPLGSIRQYSSNIRIPLLYSDVSLFNSEMKEIDFQLEPITSFDTSQLPMSDPLNYTLSFPIDIPSMGFDTFFLHINSDRVSEDRLTKRIDSSSLKENDYILENKFIKLTFSSESNLLNRIERKDLDISVGITQDWYYYSSYDGEYKGEQSSGAYIFRPNSSEPFRICMDKPEISFSKGNISSSIHQKFSSWITQTIRLNHLSPEIEIEYTVGPIPVNDGWGKEIITRFHSDVENNGIFYTDSIGRDMIQRKYNSRSSWPLTVTEPVSGNYYPLNSALYIEDSLRRLTICVDRAQGGASLSDNTNINGHFEIMVHRRLLADDHKGVGEPLNELGQDGNGLVIRGTHILLLTKPPSGSFEQRNVEQGLIYPLLPAFLPLGSSPDVYKLTHALSDKYTEGNLPLNLQLLTFRKIDGEYLIRLAHIFGTNEKVNKYAIPVVFDIQNLFRMKISKLIEYSLTGNPPRDRLKWIYHMIGSISDSSKTLSDTSVTINPLDIRTFRIIFGNEESTNSNTIYIIMFTIIGGLLVIGIVAFLVIKSGKKDKELRNEYPNYSTLQ